MSQLRTSLLDKALTILLIIIGVFLYTRIFGPLPFSVNSVQTTKTDLFTVDGRGEASAVPDTAEFSVGVTKTASTVKDAQEQVDEVISTMTKSLKDLGVEEKNIKTTNYSVNPNYDFTSGSQAIRGYNVSANLAVKVSPIEKANQALSIATSSGGNEVGAISFTLNDKKKKELTEQARKEAIDEAKEKAESMSRLSGIRLGRIVNVYESNAYQPMMSRSYDMTTENKVEPAAPQPELSPGENTIELTVSLSYETL